MIKALVIDSARKKTREQHQVQGNTTDLPLLINLTATLALPIVSSTIQYKSHYMGTLP